MFQSKKPKSSRGICVTLRKLRLRIARELWCTRTGLRALNTQLHRVIAVHTIHNCPVLDRLSFDQNPLQFLFTFLTTLTE